MPVREKRAKSHFKQQLSGLLLQVCGQSPYAIMLKLKQYSAYVPSGENRAVYAYVIATMSEPWAKQTARRLRKAIHHREETVLYNRKGEPLPEEKRRYAKAEEWTWTN